MIDKPDRWHIIPLHDLREHEDSPECWCKPQVLDEEYPNVFTHNSLDQRELMEDADGVLRMH